MPTLLFGMCVGAIVAMLVCKFVDRESEKVEEAVAVKAISKSAQPCPLCGALPTVEYRVLHWVCYHQCNEYYFYCDFGREYQLRQDAIDDWNAMLVDMQNLPSPNKPGNRTTAKFSSTDRRDSVGEL